MKTKRTPTITKRLSTIFVPIHYYHPLAEATEEVIAFTVFREDEWFKAIPALTVEERLVASLPEELVFFYSNYCVADANDMEEDSLTVIKKIIQELEVQELI